MVQSSEDTIFDGNHIKSPAELDINDRKKYRVGRCLLTTVYLEDIGLVGSVALCGHSMSLRDLKGIYVGIAKFNRCPCRVDSVALAKAAGQVLIRTCIRTCIPFSCLPIALIDLAEIVNVQR